MHLRTIRKRAVVAAAFVLLATVTTAVWFRASADPPWDPPVELQSRFNGRCLDLNPARAPSQHGRVNMYRCHGGHNQLWTIGPITFDGGLSYPGGYRIFNKMTGDCLTADGNFPFDNNGRPLITTDCFRLHQYHNPWAVWDLEHHPDEFQTVRLVNRGATQANTWKNKVVLDVNPGTDWDDGQIYLWQENGLPNQWFKSVSHYEFDPRTT